MIDTNNFVLRILVINWDSSRADMNTPRIQIPSPVRFSHISPFGSSSLSWSNPLIVGCIVIRIVIRIVISKTDTNYTCLKYQQVIVYSVSS